MPIDQAFNHTAAYYDEWVQKALPSYAEIFSVAAEIIPFDPGSVIKVLDLGAGTGLFSWHVLRKYPRAAFTLYDVADKMLEIARERFQDHSAQFSYVVEDIRNLSATRSFDLAISSLAIHHLNHAEKQGVFHRVYNALKPGGVFINVDQIQAPSERLRALYWTKWLEQVRRNGASEERIQESIQRRTTYDQDAPLEDQLRWLGEAGFTDVDCIYKNYFIGVFTAAGNPGEPMTIEEKPMEIEIKTPDQLSVEEMKEIDDLATLAYGDEEDDDNFEWSNGYWKVLGRVDGKLVCLVEILDRTCRVGGQPVRVGGVGGVATHPDHRRRGYASAAMQRATEFMRDELGLEFAMLICADERIPLYSRLGYRVVRDPVYFEQPTGKVRNTGPTMALSITGKPWPEGEVDMGGLPW